MTTPTARDSLGVIFDGAETDGFTIYGLRSRLSEVLPDFPHELWPLTTGTQTSTLHGEAWETVVWDVKIIDWPTSIEFRHKIEQTLRRLLISGCVVAWVGALYEFCDPPMLFHPDCMHGGVVAALSSETGFLMDFELDGELVSLSDDVLMALRRASGGLAESS